MNGVDVHLQSALWHIKRAGALVPEDWKRQFLEGLEHAIGGVLLVIPVEQVEEAPVEAPAPRQRRQRAPEPAAPAEAPAATRNPYMDYCETSGDPIRDCECPDHNYGGGGDAIGEDEQVTPATAMPPPAFSPGTCKECGMFDCYHDTECPYCGVSGANPCQTKGGFKSSNAHVGRRREAQRQQRAEGSPSRIAQGIECATCGMNNPCYCNHRCERCSAEAGEACVTAAGNVALVPHAARRHAGEASASG